MCFRYGRGVEEAFHRRGGYVCGIYCGLWRDGIAGFVFPHHFHVAEQIYAFLRPVSPVGIRVPHEAPMCGIRKLDPRPRVVLRGPTRDLEFHAGFNAASCYVWDPEFRVDFNTGYGIPCGVPCAVPGTSNECGGST